MIAKQPYQMGLANRTHFFGENQINTQNQCRSDNKLQQSYLQKYLNAKKIPELLLEMRY